MTADCGDVQEADRGVDESNRVGSAWLAFDHMPRYGLIVLALVLSSLYSHSIAICFCDHFFLFIRHYNHSGYGARR